jgi:hypothetical protein
MLRHASPGLAVLALLVAAGCSPPPHPIAINDGTVTVDNRTDHEWRSVLITVNDHFRGGAPRLAAGSRLTAPLSQFQTGLGQRFSLSRQTVTKIEVTATDATGQPVRLTWPGGDGEQTGH